MSRYVKVNDTEYKLTVKTDSARGTIILDTGYDPTGNNNGAAMPRPAHTVVVTGDLLVLGETTTVNTTDLNIEDNIIRLNVGDTSTGGITKGSSGIEVYRGVNSFYPAVRLTFDETVNAFTLRDVNDVLQGLQTNRIFTDDTTDLNLLGTGFGTVNVAGTTNYELQVNDDDDLPNVKWVQNWTQTYFEENPPEFIKKGDSVLQIFDSEFTAETLLQLRLDGVLSAEYRPDRIDLQDTRITGSTISSTVSNGDLTLLAPGAGSVVVDDTLKLKLVSVEPTSDASGVKVYSKDESFGGTGVFFVNTKDTKDELVSKRKALAFSMIF